MYKCPHCGGEMEFLPESGIIKCEYCGSEFTPEESSQAFRKTRKKADEHAMAEGKVYTCSQCGANIYTTEETGVTFCSYCGSQAFLESRIMGDDNIAPDMIIPFKISKEQCEQIYKDKIKSAWFLPSKMKKDNEIEKFRGIYMPCWVYAGESEAEGEYTGTTVTHMGRTDIIKTYKVEASGHGTYDGYVRDASASFPDGIMDEIAPFGTKNAVPYNDAYMTGFYADIGNVPSEAYQDDIYRTLDSNVKKNLKSNNTIKNKNVSASQINSNTNVRSKITKVRKGFLPVWFLSNKNDRTGMMSYAVINGLTGKIHTDLPIDMKKYLLLSLGIAVPVFLLLLLLQSVLAQNFAFKPQTILIITMIFLGILLVVSTKMIRDTYIQEHGLDDEGLLYLKKKQAHEDPSPHRPDVDAEGYVQSSTDQKVKAKTPSGVRIVSLGIICVVICPILLGVLGEAFDINLGGYGFAIGIAVYIALMCLGKGSKTAKSDSDLDSEPVKGKHKLPFYVMLRAILMPLIGILAAIVILIISPPHDIYYYVVVLLCCAMLILTVLDFVRSTNRLSLRKPAQLGKRGGDEDA